MFGVCSFDGVRVEHIEHIDGATTFFLQRLECSGVDVSGNDFGAFARKRQRGGATNALACGGDKGCFTG
jgi:hypothetical protein